MSQGRDGFLITTPGGPPTRVSTSTSDSNDSLKLTGLQAQIEDILAASRRHEEQLAAQHLARTGSQNSDGGSAFINHPIRIDVARRQ